MGKFSPYRIILSIQYNFAKISAMCYANRQLKSVAAFDMGNFESRGRSIFVPTQTQGRASVEAIAQP